MAGSKGPILIGAGVHSPSRSRLHSPTAIHMSLNDEISAAFEDRVFYHGTDLEATESIARHGFSVWFTDEDGDRYPSGGHLGNGIYITCNWRIALMFGVTLLRVGLKPGTRILDAAVPPDKKTLDYLQSEFGREILRKSPWKCVPANKKLRQREVICLLRYHYHATWIKKYGPDDGNALRDWSPRRVGHSKRLEDFKSILIRYGFHGYGSPGDDLGVVILDGDRVELLELVAFLPPDEYIRLDEQGFDNFKDLRPVKAAFARKAPPRARKLGREIAAAVAARYG